MVTVPVTKHQTDSKHNSVLRCVAADDVAGLKYGRVNKRAHASVKHGPVAEA